MALLIPVNYPWFQRSGLGSKTIRQDFAIWFLQVLPRISPVFYQLAGKLEPYGRAIIAGNSELFPGPLKLKLEVIDDYAGFVRSYDEAMQGRLLLAPDKDPCQLICRFQELSDWPRGWLQVLQHLRHNP